MQWSPLAETHPIREQPQLSGDKEGYPPTAEETGPPVANPYDLRDGLAGVNNDLEPKLVPGADSIVDGGRRIPVTETALPEGVDVGVGGGGNELEDGGTPDDPWQVEMGFTVWTEANRQGIWSLAGGRRWVARHVSDRTVTHVVP